MILIESIIEKKLKKVTSILISIHIYLIFWNNKKYKYIINIKKNTNKF